jgi:hypothetical protein
MLLGFYDRFACCRSATLDLERMETFRSKSWYFRLPKYWCRTAVVRYQNVEFKLSCVAVSPYPLAKNEAIVGRSAVSITL